ncbi:MAG: Hpt domain-containing protein [Nitrospira sp.]|nr:Hpt domain-containing protein [Nitrospira sp.]
MGPVSIPLKIEQGVTDTLYIGVPIGCSLRTLWLEAVALIEGDAPMDQPQSHETADDTHSEIVSVDASFEPLIPKFMTNRKKEILTMQESLTAQDLDSVRKVAHGMKGAGGSYGFDRVSEIAAVIEQAAKDGDAATIEHNLSLLGSYLERIKVVYD